MEIFPICFLFLSFPYTPSRIQRALLPVLFLCFAFRVAAAGPNVDTGTLAGKVMCGYQGWFNCEGDAADRGWVHWTKGRGPLAPGNAKIDLWPDVSGFGDDERFA